MWQLRVKKVAKTCQHENMTYNFKDLIMTKATWGKNNIYGAKKSSSTLSLMARSPSRWH
jgi:hypothetical protein